MSQPLIILALAVLVLIALDIAAIRWGADSRRPVSRTGSLECRDQEWW